MVQAGRARSGSVSDVPKLPQAGQVAKVLVSARAPGPGPVRRPGIGCLNVFGMRPVRLRNPPPYRSRFGNGCVDSA